MPGLRIYFLVLLVGVVGNYLLSYRMVVLVADQRSYVVNAYTLIIQGSRQLLQIAALRAFDSYLLYVALFVLGSVSTALVLYWRSGRVYPVLRRPAQLVTADERRSLLRNVRAMLVYRVSGVVMNNLTPAFVVSMLGVTVGGRYGNYLLLVGAASALLESVFLSMTASVGHLASTSSPEAARRVFDELTLTAAMMYGIPAVALAACLGDFVTLWLGPGNTLSTQVVLAMVAGFLVYGLTMPVLVFRTGTGLFRDARYVLLLTATLNLILIQALGQSLGLVGIVAAAPLARLAGNYWMEPLLLTRRHIGGGMARFWGRHLAILAAVSVSTTITLQIPLDDVDPLSLRVLLDITTAVAVTSVVMLACFGMTSEFSTLIERIRTLIPRRRSARNGAG